MADSLITNLTNVTSPTGAEELPVNVPGSPDTDGKVVLSALAAYVEGTLGNAAGLDVGTATGTVAAGDDSRLSDARAPTAHASTHTNGTDDIQDATSGQKGLMTAAQATKLDGIEAAADVTDATNVAAAGALMTSALGTGVETALAVNVGSAGAPVINGGALGTPSSGTLTNATSLPISTGVAGLGSGVATALAIAPNTTGGFATYPVSGGGGKVAQVVFIEDSTQVTSSVTVPLDDTVPQDTEGTLYSQLSATITPTDASSKLLIDVHLVCQATALQSVIGMVFRSGTADALAANWDTVAGVSYVSNLRIRTVVPVLGLSSETFNVRFGRTSSGTVYLNDYTTPYYGGSIKSSISITEILP